jgi:hypothetical protein
VWHRTASNKPQVNESRLKCDDGGPPTTQPKARVDTLPGLRKTRIVSHEQGATNSGDIPNRPVSLDALVRETRDSLLRAQKASRCLTAANPDSQYSVNKFKWCAAVCREARLACRFSDQETDSIHTSSMRSRAVIEQFWEELLQALLGLFSRLALVQQKSTAPRLSRFMLIDLSTVFLDMGKEGGRRERLWLDAFAQLKKLINLTLDPQRSVKVLHQMIEHCTDPRRLARYHLYSYLYDVVYECYRIDTTTANEAIEWKSIVIHLKESISLTMRDDFLSLSKLFAAKSHEGEKSTIYPEELITRHLHGKQFAEGHYALAQAHEAAANISDSETGDQELESALYSYLEAHELLKSLHKEKAGLALAKVGLLRWRFYPKNLRPATIQFLRAAEKFEKYADRDAWWVKETKKYIAIYQEELVALGLERERKEKEERARREKREKEERECAEKLRCEAMLDNIEVLKEQAQQIHVLDDLFIFSEWLQRDFSPPESYAQQQLHLHIVDLKNRQGSRRIYLKKIIRLYHPDKNGGQGDTWKLVCSEVTKVRFL